MNTSSFLLLALVFFLRCGMVTAQQALTESEKIPHVKIVDQFLAAENFPAYSHKENAVLIVHQNYSCCYSYGTFLQKISLRGGFVVQQFMLYPPEDSIYLIDINEQELAEQIELLLKDGSYRSMEQISKEDFGLVRPLSSNISAIRIWFEGTVIESSVKVSDFDLPPYCCAEGENPAKHCSSFPRYYDLWLDKRNSILLLAYGIRSQDNGCDAGPRYSIRKL